MEIHAAVHQYATDARHRRLLDSISRPVVVDVLVPSIQEALDRVTCMTGQALEVTAVCASLVDGDRRLLTSSYGLPVPTALLVSHAFRKHVVASRRPLVVADGRSNPLVAQNPAVRDGTVRACVGMPLRTGNGRAVGALLAMDRRPRQWTARQLDLLEKVSALIISEMVFGAAVRRASHGDEGSEERPGEVGSGQAAKRSEA